MTNYQKIFLAKLRTYPLLVASGDEKAVIETEAFFQKCAACADLHELSIAKEVLDKISSENGKMINLGDLNYAILSNAIKHVGTYDPEEVLAYCGEQIRTSEYVQIHEFLSWVNKDEINRCFGSGNYDERFKQFLEETGVPVL